MAQALFMKIAAGGRRLAVQVAMSVVAASCAAVIVPRVVTMFGTTTQNPPVRLASGARLAAPAADLDEVFRRQPVRPPDRLESALVEKAAAIVPVVATAATMPRPVVARVAERRRVPAPVPEPRPQAPLEFAAMTVPVSASPPPATAERPKLFGLSLPRLPMEDRITGAIASARGSVARLFN
ncbi:MAG: hypothetical protein LCH88_04845 [Proteobacteria bacterium]|nr:hypothetical protein [Pseudomonadota bacterium]